MSWEDFVPDILKFHIYFFPSCIMLTVTELFENINVVFETVPNILNSILIITMLNSKLNKVFWLYRNFSETGRKCWNFDRSDSLDGLHIPKFSTSASNPVLFENYSYSNFCRTLLFCLVSHFKVLRYIIAQFDIFNLW